MHQRAVEPWDEFVSVREYKSVARSYRNCRKLRGVGHYSTGTSHGSFFDLASVFGLFLSPPFRCEWTDLGFSSGAKVLAMALIRLRTLTPDLGAMYRSTAWKQSTKARFSLPVNSFSSKTGGEDAAPGMCRNTQEVKNRCRWQQRLTYCQERGNTANVGYTKEAKVTKQANNLVNNVDNNCTFENKD